MIIEVKNSADTWLGNVRVSIPKGTGSTSGTIIFANDLPLANGYKLSAFMVPTGLDWQSIIVADNSTFNVVLVTGLNKDIYRDIKLYPNPTEGVIHLGFDANWEIYSTMGIKLKEGQSDTIDLSQHENGVYLIKCGNQVFRILKL